MAIQDNIFPLTEEEILEQYPHVFDNEFQTRFIQHGSVWNQWTNEKSYDWFGSHYTKGHSTAAILINKQGEKDYVEFWKYAGNYKNNYKTQYGYSFKKRELFPTILN